MRRWSLRILAVLVAVFALVYVADWIGLQIREHGGSAHGSVVVDNADIVKEKGGKVEYYFDAPQPTPCVHALFPHEGQAACWWLARHSEEQKFVN